MIDASRRAAISPFHVMEVMQAAADRAALGGDVLHLEVGQPSTSAPAGVRAAAHRAIDDDVIGYAVALGHEPLRHRIADHYRHWYGADVDPGRIVITAGASAGCVLAILAAFDPGDRVAVSAPGYPCYRNMLEALGVDAVPLAVDERTRFQPTVELLDRAGPLDGVVIASPSNPTGTMLDGPALTSLLDHCRTTGVRVIADEIYHGITFGEPAPTAATNEQVVVVNSFSKYFSMTGWRLGWTVLPPELVTPVERLTQNLYIAPSTLSQHAAMAAFDCHDELEANVARYAENRTVLLEGLAEAGFERLAPADGAFYVYAAVDHLTDDSQALCARWLDELGIAATPGVDFDPERGHQWVRFSFAGATAQIALAVERLRSSG